MAHPYTIVEQYKVQTKKEYELTQAYLDDINNSFVTRSFLVKFCDEDIQINDVCHFRIEIDAYPFPISSELYLECWLEYLELETSNPIKMIIQQDSFEQISHFKSKINNILKGVHDFVPIIFDEDHFCLVNSSFHAILYDFKFQHGQMETSYVTRLSEDSDNTQLSNDYQTQNTVLNNFSEFYQLATDNYNQEKMNYLNKVYIKTAQNSFKNLKQHIRRITELCYKDNVKKEEKFQKFIQNHFEFLKEEQELQQSWSQIYNSGDIQIKDNENNSILEVSEKNSQIVEEDQKIIQQKFLKDLQDAASKMWLLMHNYVQLFLNHGKELCKVMKLDYHHKVKDRWGESIFMNRIETLNLIDQHIDLQGISHKSIAKSLRKKKYYQSLEPLNVQDLNMFPQAELHPIVFMEIHKLIQQKTSINSIEDTIYDKKIQQIQDKHIFVLVHGFQGTQFDMRLFKNNLSVLYPKALFLSSCDNEEFTEGNIQECGNNLAKEVKRFQTIFLLHRFIKTNCQYIENSIKISFIGHSLGGVIIRTALPLLSQYKNCMKTFISLSSPHLGYMYHSSSLIDAGMWVLKKMKKSISLSQLSMTDHQQFEQTFMYQLSLKEGLNWFDNIVLLSSQQDQYVPYQSARIQSCKQSHEDQILGTKYNKMAESILQNLKTDVIHRIDVNFKMKHKSFDTMIGRAAHIEFLENEPLIRLFIYSFNQFFD